MEELLQAVPSQYIITAHYPLQGMMRPAACRIIHGPAHPVHQQPCSLPKATDLHSWPRRGLPEPDTDKIDYNDRFSACNRDSKTESLLGTMYTEKRFFGHSKNHHTIGF